MASDPRTTMQRREFLKLAGAAAAAGVSKSALAAPSKNIIVLVDSTDTTATSAPVKWAVSKFQQALSSKGATCSIASDIAAVPGSASLVVVVAGDQSSAVKSFPTSAAPLNAPESLRLTPGKIGSTPAIWISAIDARGFIYGVLELAERVQFSQDETLGLNLTTPIVETTANKVRCIARAFCSDIEDKSWYYSKEFWRSYLDVVATSRFNRFAFVFGFGYDFPKGVTGDYFHFPYPYLVDVPGYKVSVTPLEAGEREKNLEILQFIAAETAARGLEFQLGIWTHAYEWTDSPKADHHVIGLTAENHAAYCRDALAMVLKACPEITGLTMRVHGESGVPEGSYPFWKTLFEAISGSGRKIEIDMHAKGINQIMIDMASDTGMPVKVSAKSWAEHMGLGYHQADIRELEIPTPARMESGIFNVSNGERRFTRYGYADLYQEGRKYDVLYRLWPGTQRHLLWGDPEMAAAYGRTANFCGAAGIEICEPLTFKGREGSGHPGGRCAYVDASMNPKLGDWQKFEYTYRLWGRMLYNPDTKPEVWRRYLTKDFGPAYDSVERALANASRVLPLVTTAHLPSASNHSFWPEMYENMPIVPGQKSPYNDTPDPKLFGTVSPLDPQLFSTIVEHIHGLLGGDASAKYSPAEVAQWLEDYTNVASQSLELARKQARSRTSPEFRRMEEDVLIQIGLGQFFAAKLRSAMLFEIYLQTGNEEAGKLALTAYQKARTAWFTMAERAKGVYVADVSYGNIPMRRGHWMDRIPDIDKDVAAMQAKLRDGSIKPSDASHATTAIHAVTMKPHRASSGCSHTAATSFHPGQPLPLSLHLTGSGDAPSAVKLYYRHVNQGERWKTVSMEKKQQMYTAEIPGDYTNSLYPLQYYFELTKDTSAAWFYPAFNTTLSNQPYYALYQRT
ncbi:hypothetical protein FTO74_07790 [Granulicella sp. WH15]|uniref:hypothetical protein n=1 Tax=Granulicella sp. WH15 TaxID=2602070 RepID=UPI00136696B6|nr:hypothetical protein [Granulicella sp. WH15]QHN03278.1 hypothetical protein FTO74_07790 [Granulicella sp. WH15]